MIKKPKVAFAFMIFFLFASFNVAAFSARKCGKTFRDLSRKSYSVEIVSSMIDSASSIAQFISSTGNCAAIGMNGEEQAQLFYAINYDKVLEDIARGQGEFYLSLAKLWGCNQKIALNKVYPIRSRYSNLLSLSEERQYEFIKEHVSCKNDQEG